MATGMYKMALRMIPVNPYYIDGALFLFGLFFRMATQGNDPVISQLSFSDLGGPCPLVSEVLLNIMCLAHSSIQGRVAPPLCPEVGTVGVLGKLGLWVKLSISSKMGSTVRNPVASGAGQEEPPICDRTWC